MTRRELAKQIDDLGKLRDRLHALKFQANALGESVRQELRGIKGKAARGERYQAELVRADRLVIEDLAALRKAAGRKFLQVVKADVQAARRALSAEVLEALARRQRAWQLKVYRMDPATAPRKAPRWPAEPDGA